jgi:hypothetical protein
VTEPTLLSSFLDHREFNHFILPRNRKTIKNLKNDRKAVEDDNHIISYSYAAASNEETAWLCFGHYEEGGFA